MPSHRGKHLIRRTDPVGLSATALRVGGLLFASRCPASAAIRLEDLGTAVDQDVKQGATYRPNSCGPRSGGSCLSRR